MADMYEWQEYQDSVLPVWLDDVLDRHLSSLTNVNDHSDFYIVFNDPSPFFHCGSLLYFAVKFKYAVIFYWKEQITLSHFGVHIHFITS